MMKHKNLAAVGLSVAALLLAACGGGGDPLGQQSSAAPSASARPECPDRGRLGELHRVQPSSPRSTPRPWRPRASSPRPSSTSAPARSTSRPSRTPPSRSCPSTPATCWAYFDKDTTAKTAEEVEAALPDALPEGLEVLKSSTAVDQDVYVVSKEFAEQNGRHLDRRPGQDHRRRDGGRVLRARAARLRPEGLDVGLRRQGQGVQAVRLGRADGRGAEQGQRGRGRPVHHGQCHQPQPAGPAAGPASR